MIIGERIIEYPDGRKEWRLDEKLHRADGPALEYPNGSKFWYLNGKCHRVDGPAIELNSSDMGFNSISKKWYINGELHRTDGPAVEYTDGSKDWYVNGNWIDFKEIIRTHELNPDWTQWTDSEKVLFRLAV